MDWSDVVLLLIFIALPLLQQLMEWNNRRSGTDVETDESPIATESDRRWRPGADAPDSAEASEEEEQWWLEGAEELSGREVIDEEEADRLVVFQSRLPSTAPEAVRVSSPVVSLETERPEAPAQPARRVLAPVALPRRAATMTRPDVLLRGPGGLRRAMLIAEVLSPPKSLR